MVKWTNKIIDFEIMQIHTVLEKLMFRQSRVSMCSADLVGGKLLGLYFYDRTLTGRIYLDYSVNQLLLLLGNVTTLATRENKYIRCSSTLS
jgi:hypothetical protein